VTALGELLEAIHGARRSLGSVEGTLREWRDERLVVRLGWDHDADEVYDDRRWPAEEEREQLTDFKLALPDRLRVETRVPGGPVTSIVVCDGSRRGTWFADWGAEVEDQNPRDVSWALGSVGRLLDPSWLLGLLEFDSPRQTREYGPALVARGLPRYPLPWPFSPADEHELVVDPARGTVIRLAGLQRRNEVLVHEFVELEHDPTFDEESFVLPTGGVVSGLGLPEAAALAGFGLWALPRPVLNVTYRPEPVESVTLEYDDALVVLTPASVPQGFVSWGEPESIERGGRTYWLESQAVVFFTDDALIRLSHWSATGEELIDLAEALVRVRD
jgi:hypothetical protein